MDDYDDEKIRCRINIDPAVHRELAYDLRKTRVRKRGDRLAHLAALGLMLQGGRVMPSPASSSQLNQESAENENVPSPEAKQAFLNSLSAIGITE